MLQNVLKCCLNLNMNSPNRATELVFDGAIVFIEKRKKKICKQSPFMYQFVTLQMSFTLQYKTFGIQLYNYTIEAETQI